MDEYHCKRSGQIPAFGNWDYSNNLPITQYFESARQAGLLRYSSSSGESDLYVRRSCGGRDLPAGDSKKPSRNVNGSLPRKTRVGEKRGPQVKEQKKQQQVKKVCDNHVTQPPRKQPPPLPRSKYGVVTPTQPPVRPPKAVDEDLYKIPPELLHSHNNRSLKAREHLILMESGKCSARIKQWARAWEWQAPEASCSVYWKKMTGFFSCLVPACAS